MTQQKLNLQPKEPLEIHLVEQPMIGPIQQGDMKPLTKVAQLEDLTDLALENSNGTMSLKTMSHKESLLAMSYTSTTFLQRKGKGGFKMASCYEINYSYR